MKIDRIKAGPQPYWSWGSSGRGLERWDMTRIGCLKYVFPREYIIGDGLPRWMGQGKGLLVGRVCVLRQCRSSLSHGGGIFHL